MAKRENALINDVPSCMYGKELASLNPAARAGVSEFDLTTFNLSHSNNVFPLRCNHRLAFPLPAMSNPAPPKKQQAPRPRQPRGISISASKKGVKTTLNFLQQKPATRARKSLRPVSAPASRSFVYTHQPPQWTRRGEANVIHHTETLGTVTSTQSFNVNPISFNPGLYGVVPYLAPLANNFLTYCMDDFRIHYVPRTGSDQPGSMILGMDYSLQDLVGDIAENELDDYDRAQDTGVWQPITFVADTKAMMGGMSRKYIRELALGLNQDNKTYDAGNILIGTSGGPATALAWGKIFIEYTISFYTCTIPAQPSGPDAGYWNLTGVTTANDICTGYTIGPGNTLVGDVTVGANTLTIYQAGTYQIQLLFGAQTSYTSNSVSLGGSAVYAPFFNAGHAFPTGSGTILCGITMLIIVTEASPGTVTLSSTVVGTTNGELIISLMPTGVQRRRETRTIASLSKPSYTLPWQNGEYYTAGTIMHGKRADLQRRREASTEPFCRLSSSDFTDFTPPPTPAPWRVDPDDDSLVLVPRRELTKLQAKA
jgi:hypothetical protein